MPETPVSVWGSTVTFNGNLVGRIKDIGGATETKTIESFLTCDSVTNEMEKLITGSDPGELPLVLLFEPSNIGNYKLLKTDFDAESSATVTVTYGTGGAQKTGTALITSLGDARGSAGGLFECDVTFARSGAQTYTSD